jgi:glycosyltransferase involved in cell wall biosynthesis
MEWIIIDDGNDPIEDLVADISGVKYFRYEEKMTLGRKRNLMHEKSKGSIIVYMDDDDYYPPERVSHAVSKLTKDKKALCAGSSAIYIWFHHNEQMYQFGPYGPNHSTAGTFAFKRELLKQTSYEDDASLAEEKHFLKNYTIPFVQLDPLKTILVFSHDHNTFDKRELLKNPNPKYVKESSVSVKTFIKDDDTRDFYTVNVNKLLAEYEPGLPIHKPDVIKQTQEIKERREKMMKEEMKKQAGGSITVTGPDGKTKEITVYELVEISKRQQEQLINLINVFKKMKESIDEKNNAIKSLKDKIKQLEENQTQETITYNLS